MKKLYTILIKPRSTDISLQNRELVLNCLLIGAIILSTLELCIATFVYEVSDFSYLLPRLVSMATITALFVGLYYLAHFRGYFRFVAAIFAILFFAIATFVVYAWGPVTPAGMLLFSLAIVVAGILLGARYSLYAAGLTIITLGLLQHAQTNWGLQPDVSWMLRPSSQRDVISFGVIFVLIAGVSWLFNHQMEASLRRAQKSEAALARQKALLEVKVEERTRQLEAAQVEKMKQVYRFAELGRVSSALFHDLANHLTNVSLDIEGLEPQRRSKIMQRIQQDIHYIDDVVQRVRFQLRGQSEIERFSVRDEIEQIVTILSYQANRARVKISVSQHGTRTLYYTGDVTRFRQVASNLIANAIEAYPKPRSNTKQQRAVEVFIKASKTNLAVTVTDHGAGISKARQAKIFEPFYTDKVDGTGIGLFIVKQIVEQDLGGTIELVSSTKHGTEFTVSLPLKS